MPWHTSIAARAIDLLLWIRYPRQAALFIWRNRRLPSIALPRTANDKFLWRKLIDHDPRFVLLSDKLLCKQWVAKRAPELHIAEVVWSGERSEDLPRQHPGGELIFKANHSTATNHFLSAESWDRDALLQLGKQWLRRNHARKDYQWGYFQVPRQLFLERRIGSGQDVPDELKIYTFGERIERVVHIMGRFDGMRANVWLPNAQGQLQRSSERAAVAPPQPAAPLPAAMDQALAAARRLGAEFDHIRVDLLWDGNALWLGELTVYNLSGQFPGAAGNDPCSRLATAWDLQRSDLLRHPQQGWRRRYAERLRHWLAQEGAISASNGCHDRTGPSGRPSGHPESGRN